MSKSLINGLHQQTSFTKFYQLFLSQLTSELFRQKRGNSPFNSLGRFFIPKEVNTRRREKGLIPNQFSRTTFKQRSLKISILKLYNWFHSANLIPYHLKNFICYAIKSYLIILNENYLRDK